MAVLPNSVTDKFRGTLPQLLATLAGTVSCISDGMQYGWTAPVIPILLSNDSPLEVTEHQAEWLENILMLGACCGIPVTMYLVDKIGRKKSLLTSSTTTLLAWVVIALAPHVNYVFVARFFAGMAGDMAFVAAPMYIAEMADQKIRGFLSSMIYLMMLTGILTMYCIGPFVPLYIPCIVAIICNAIELCTFPFMPDSPYYLLYNGKENEARESLKRLRSREDVEEELSQISLAVKRQKTEKGRPQDLILIKSNFKALIIMVWLNGSQHMSSISVMLMNVHSILDEAGTVHIASSTAAIIFSAIMLCAAMSASLAIDNFGRKCLLIISGMCSGFSLAVIAAYFTLKNNGFDITEYTFIPAMAVMFYAASFKFGIGLVPIVLTAELFPAKLKAIGMTLSDACYVGFSFISLQIYHQLRNRYGIEVPFYIFACWCFATVVFTICFIPETKGKTLEEIQMILKGEHKATKECINHSDGSRNGHHQEHYNEGFVS